MTFTTTELLSLTIYTFGRQYNVTLMYITSLHCDVKYITY